MTVPGPSDTSGLADAPGLADAALPASGSRDAVVTRDDTPQPVLSPLTAAAIFLV